MTKDYLTESNPDLKKLRMALESGKVNGLFSTKQILDLFTYL